MSQGTRRIIGYVLFGLFSLFLVGLVTRSVLAGPQNVAKPSDVEGAKREVLPDRGSDERTQLPQGEFVAGNGVVEPQDRETKVAAEVPGRIASIFVREGEFVRAGSPLLELAADTERAALAVAEADLEAAKGELTRTMRGMRKEDVDAVIADTASLKARAELSQTTLQRMQQLAKTGSATPDELDRASKQAETDAQTYEAAEARRRAAVAGSRAEDILVARAKHKAAEARVAEARARLARLTIRAPLDGEVLQLKVRVGEYYAPGGDALVVMGDTRTLRVRIDVDERDVARVKLGQSGFVTASAFPGQRFKGRVVELGRHMGRKNVRTDDPVERIDTKILEVLLELEPKASLVPGQRVVAYIETAP